MRSPASPDVRRPPVPARRPAHRETGQAVGAEALAGLAGFSPPTLHSLGARVASGLSKRWFNLVITNVPGPQQPLYAGVLTTAPLHWQGDLATIRELMIDTYVTRMQGSTPTEAQAQALGVWLDELRAPLANPPPLDEWQQQGQQVFVATGCATCHSGDRFTDNVAHDVGTGARFQTPSLIGLRYSAPYMHDGCAATLEQRFDDACGGETHGEFWTLDPDQLSQLLAYLHTL